MAKAEFTQSAIQTLVHDMLAELLARLDAYRDDSQQRHVEILRTHAELQGIYKLLRKLQPQFSPSWNVSAVANKTLDESWLHHDEIEQMVQQVFAAERAVIQLLPQRYEEQRDELTHYLTLDQTNEPQESQQVIAFRTRDKPEGQVKKSSKHSQ